MSNLVQWPAAFALVATAIALIYYSAPDAEREFAWITPGSVLATVLGIVVWVGLKFYLATAGSRSGSTKSNGDVVNKRSLTM